MSLIDLALISVVALLCGSAAQLTSGYARGGWIVHMTLGFMGAAAGVLLSRMFNFPEIYDVTTGTNNFPIVWALVGSVFLVAAVGLFVKPSQH